VKGRALAVDTRLPVSMLEEMVVAAQQELERRQAQYSLEQLEEQLQHRDVARPFGEALARRGLSVIAEFKRRSPSAGDIALTADVANQVSMYEVAGAAALSILTHETAFGGQLEDLQAARAASELPILRKDFIVDEFQLYEAAAFGADAVLLIAAVLDTSTLSALHRKAADLDLDCIVEVRTQGELESALQIDASIIGINNRDLGNLEIDVNRTFELLTQIPTGKTVVSESGIEHPDQISRLREAGVDAVLIGHSLMHAEDPEKQMRFLLREDEGTRELQIP
jgi:indole-3-glycerol phosphate synthase